MVAARSAERVGIVKEETVKSRVEKWLRKRYAPERYGVGKEGMPGVTKRARC
jgi:hypothetical protein